MAAPAIERLTPRERECLRLVARGYGTKAIALQLNVSTAHVAKVIHSANRKLQVSSRMDAARLLARHEGGEVFVVGGMANPLPDDLPAPPIPAANEEGTQPTILREERSAFGTSDPTVDLGQPFRKRGGTRNELTTWQRAVWMILLFALALIGVGTLTFGLGSLSNQIILVPVEGR
jgi:DNA-binding CsgD family transcriptional regulator